MALRMKLLAPVATVLLLVTACASPAGEPSELVASESEEAMMSHDASMGAEPSMGEEDGGETGEATVRIRSSNFDPAELTVAAGTEVTFLNADAFGHTVTEGTDGTAVDDPIVDEPIGQNGSVSVTFEEPGTYDITCKIHPSMQMTVIVEG